MNFFQYLIDITLQFIEQNHIWATPVIFFLAFGESLALLSLVLPATAVLVAAGALIGAGALPFLPIWLAATLGAILGDWLSFWLGKHYHQQIITLWPLSKNKRLLVKGEQFFQRFGSAGIFIGRFFGPLRAIVPLIAGAMGMSKIKFNAANLASAPLWAFLVLAPGSFGIPWLERIFG